MRNYKNFLSANIFVFAFLIVVTAVFSCNTEKEESDKKKYGEEETEGKYDKQYMLEAMYKQWDDKQRDPATGKVPVERLYTAWERTRDLLQAKKENKVSGISGVKWTTRGPSNVGGRTRSIMISPNDATGNTGFAGGVGGGIWKSVNLRSGSPTWSPITDLVQNLAISSITYDPANTNIFYAGTGEGFNNSDAARGLGILKSVDGGTTWNFLPSTININFYYVNKVAVNSLGHIYAATRSGIFRSLDGGNTWGSSVLFGNFGDIEITSNDIYYASKASFPSALYKSTTGASASWVNLTATAGSGLPNTKNQRIETAVAPSDPNTVYSMFYRDTFYTIFGTSYYSSVLIYRSTNGGTSFVKVATPNDADTGIPDADFTRSQGWFDLILQVDPNVSQTVYAGGINIFKSTSGGSTWRQIAHWYAGFSLQYAHADQHGMAFQRNSSDVLYFTHDGGISQTTNATALTPTILTRNNNYTVTQFYAFDYHPDAGSNYFLAGAQDNGTQQFNSPGFGPTVFASGGDGAYCNIDKVDPNNQFSQYVFNNYYRSTDGGANFEAVTVPGTISGTGRFINPSDYDGVSKTLYAAANYGDFMRWKNATTSTSFDLVKVTGMQGQVSALTVSATTPDKIYLGTDFGEVMEVTNASTVSAPAVGRNLGAPSNGYLNCIWEDAANSNHLIAVYSSYGVNSVVETLNASDATPTWVAKDGDLPDMPIYWVLPDPSNTTTSVFIATELGVYSSSNFNDASPQWLPTSDDMAYTRVTQIKLRKSDNLVIASTHGRGLFTCDIFQAPAASFYLDKTLTHLNKDVNFYDNSVKATSWQWDFNNDGIFESTQQNPVKQFTTAGINSVRLRINGDPLLEKILTVQVLPYKGTPYQLANGGNFDVNIYDFAATNTGTSAFSLGNSVQPGKDGTHSGANAWVIDIDKPLYVPYSTAYLYTPDYNCTAAGTYTLSFYAKYKIETTWDGFRVEYSTDKGDNWQLLGNVLQANWYDYANPEADRPFPQGEAYFSNVNATAYTLCKYATTVFAGQPNVAFRIVFQSDPAVVDAGLALDDFTLEGPPNIVLPVRIVNFTGTNNGDKNTLQWKTGSEINNNRYEIERSFDGRQFDKIASVKSKNSSTGAAYTTGDNIAALKTNNFYYRLRIVDNDGAYSYSQVVNIKLNGRPERITVMGNITNGPVKIIVPAALLNAPLQADIISAGGNIIKKLQLSAVTNNIDISQLAAGNYYIRFNQNGKAIQTEKIIKQ